MGLANDLLRQADQLAYSGTSKPRQADLRRAVSSAYYALFHLLVADGAAQAGSRLSVPGKMKIRRAFVHAEMKVVCTSYAKNNIPASIAPLLTYPLDANLRKFAQAFVDLQEARHSADYDLSVKFNRVEVLLLIDTVKDAFSDWKTIRKTENSKIFLMDLLLRKLWTKV